MWKEFKDFARRGNVVDLAIGVIIGGAFGRIVTSLVNDIIMPVLGLALGKVNLDNLFIILGEGNFTTLEEAKAAGVATINYGLFLNNILTFLITAFAIFLMIRQINRLKDLKERITSNGEEETEVVEVKPTTKKCIYCFSTIHIDATRCAQCTAVLPEPEATEA